MMDQSPRRSSRMALPAFVAVLLTALLSGCGTPEEEGFTERSIQEMERQLDLRSVSEEMVNRYDHMMQRIRDRLDSELGPFEWQRTGMPSWSPCGRDFPLHDKTVIVSSPLWTFNGTLSADQWAQAHRIVADIAVEYRFETSEPLINLGGAADHHLTHGFDPELGAYFDFGTGTNTGIRVTTGCHRTIAPTAYPWVRK